jgi:hypothetical protein
MNQIGGRQQIVDDPDDCKSSAIFRAATPSLDDADNPLNNSKPFAGLSRQDQLYLIRPHLLRVIRDEYPPSQARIDAFYNREKPLYLVGDYKEAELSFLFPPELKRWLLRPHANTIVSPPCSDLTLA